MAATLDDSGFWLPTHFPTEVQNDAGICFPSEFPYEVESVFSSDGSDDDDFLGGLTRRFAHTSFHETQRLDVPCFASENQKRWVSAGSPQSTLSGIVSGNGSPNQVSSPPATALGFSDDTWELIYAAAGEVARLKMKGESARLGDQHGRGLLGPPLNTSYFSNQTTTRNLPQFQQVEHGMKAAVWGRQVKAGWPTHLHPQHQQAQRMYIQNRGCAPSLERPWPQRQYHNPPPQTPRNGPLYLCGTAPKREATGTGVFLPRRYTSPTGHRKKTGCTPVLVPAKVVQALNLSFNDMNGHSQPCEFKPSYGAEAMRGGRGGVLMQQRRSMPEGHFGQEVRLPPKERNTVGLHKKVQQVLEAALEG